MSLAMTCSTPSTLTIPATGNAERLVSVPLHEQDHQSRHVPLQHRARYGPNRFDLEPASVLYRDPHCQWAEASIGKWAGLPSLQYWAVSPPRTIPRSLQRRSIRFLAVAKCSPGSGLRAFMLTLVPFSISAILRPFEQDHATFGLADTGLGAMAAGVNSTKGVNVHSIALQVPKTDLAKGGSAPTNASSPSSVIGVWTTASRQKATLLSTTGGSEVASGPWIQVSRLGNPLVNEVVVPMSKKDFWNSQPPSDDKQFAAAVANPELAQLLPTLYPMVFPNLSAFNSKSPVKRADLLAIFLTGIPSGVVAGFQNSMGTTQADMLRLNMAIPPTTTGRATLVSSARTRRDSPTAAASSTMWSPSSSRPSREPRLL